MRKVVLLALICASVIAALKPALAYKFTGSKWPSPSLQMYVSLGAPSWDDAFVAAMSLWNQNTVFQFSYLAQAADPCTSPTPISARNGTKFSTTVCGEAFGNSTLAVTLTYTPQGGTNNIQSGVIFNSNKNWNVYDGPWSTGLWAGVMDFRRVALHELGHVMGLDHEDSVPAIMATAVTTAGDITTPQSDDIAGVNALYGGTSTPDATGPALSITSHSNGQSTPVSSVTLSGTATDAGRGDSGISSITVNGVRAAGDTATGAGTANWSRAITLASGSNTITVVARDNSANQNSTTQVITLTQAGVAPSNDNFSGAISLAASGSITGSNVGATPESGEPGNAGGGANSVWWRWTAPSSGPANFDTIGSDFNTFLAAYTGGSVSALTMLAQDNDGGGNSASRITFSAIAGTTYFLAVTGSFNASGGILLNWQGSVAPDTRNTYHVFPQFADGVLPDGSFYRSTLMISNPSNTSAVGCTFRLNGGVTLDGVSVFDYSLGASGWVIAPSSGAQAFRSGYATLQCSANVEAQLLYSFYSAAGIKISEATVFSSPLAESVDILADSREGARVGIAIANDSDDNVTYSISAIDSGGAAAGAGSVTVGGKSSRAAFLDELMAILPGFVGQVVVTSAGGPLRPASVIGLRFTRNVFTTIPGVMRSVVGPTASTYHIFPQLADGRLADGAYYRTTLMISNTSNAAAACTFRLHGLTINGSSASTYTIAAHGFLISPTSGTQSIRTGYATLQCSTSVEAQLLYSFYAPDGTKLSEATVFSSPTARSVQILADSREGSRVGLAIANDFDQSFMYTIAAYGPTGNIVGSSTFTLAARTSRAAFLDELVAAPAGHYGQVTVSSGTGSAGIIGLRFTGSAFTTVPETVR